MDTFSLLFAPVCLNVVFLFLPRSLTAALFRSLCYARGLGKIISHPAGHSVVTGFQATKKAGTQMRTNFPQKDRLIPAVWLHIHVTGFEIQSRNCPLRLPDCRQFKAIQKRRYFPLAYRRRCPAYCRSLNQFVKIDIQLWWQINYQFYYIEQMFACQDCSPFSIELSCEFHRTVRS